MGWIATLVKTIASADSIAFVVTDLLPCEDGATVSELLKPDACYIEVFVDGLWLPKARKFTSEIHGVVHAFSKVARLGEGKTEIAFVSAPSDLAKVDGRSVNRVVTRSRKVFGPVPWRGQELELEIGLFSVKSGDLTGPYLELMDTLSSQAGVSFVSAAAPFVPVIRKGMELLTGNAGASSLEIGLDTAISMPRAGRYALIAADRNQIQEAQLSVAKDGWLMVDGTMLRDYPWLVYRIDASSRRADFGDIPELKDAWRRLMTCIQARKRADAEEALNNLRVTALTSPDLIPTDADALTAKGANLMRRAFSGRNRTRFNLLGDDQLQADLTTVELRDVDLYGDGDG
jgi:hypothetical protein